MTQNDELSRIINNTEVELFTLLGSALLGVGLGVTPTDDDRKRRFAMKWLQERQDQLRRQVCGTATEAFINNVRGVADRLSEAAVVADALGAVYGHPTANIVAVILVKRGLAAFCGSHE